MFNIEKTLEGRIQWYLRMRRTFRILEMIYLVGIIFAAFMEEKKDGTLVILVITGILLCVAFFEGEIAIYRSGLKSFIKAVESSWEKDLKVYSEFKEELEKTREEYISKISALKLPNETLKSMINEEIGFVWMSQRIKYYKLECDITEKKLAELKEKRRLVSY